MNQLNDDKVLEGSTSQDQGAQATEGTRGAGPAAALKEVRDAAFSAASSVRDAATEEANEAVVRGKEGVAGHIDALVSAIEASARELHSHDSPLAAAADSVARSLRSTAQHLHEQNPAGLAGEVSSFARTHPLMFILGSAAAGFALARVTKAGDTAENARKETAQ